MENSAFYSEPFQTSAETISVEHLAKETNPSTAGIFETTVRATAESGQVVQIELKVDVVDPCN